MDTTDSPSGRSKIFLIVLILAVAGLIVLWWLGKVPFWGGGASSEYQAVFLSNGQVYFGKLSNIRTQYPVLTDIYYLQATQGLQPSSGSAQQDLTLIKLGKELHGPMDEMVINRDHILFYEQLAEDSQIVSSIKASRQTTPSAP